MTLESWTVEYWQLPILRFGVHGQLIVRDNRGAIVRSYEGLATGRDGRIKPIGTRPGDRIKAYARAGAPWTTLTERQHPRQRLLTAPEADIAARLKLADQAGAAINALDCGYPMLGVIGRHTNSNAVISTLCAIMHLPPPRPGGYAPGHGVALLAPAMAPLTLPA